LESKIIGIYWSPWDHWNSKDSDQSFGLLARIRQHRFAMLRPRTREYMKELFEKEYQTGSFLEIENNSSWANQVCEADIIVLLYPDPIGYGFNRIEKQVLQLKDPKCALWALNGRRRKILLNLRTRNALFFRRMIRKFMVVEVFLSALFVLVTPFLVVVDQWRGRK
jgi:hypothetical protein